MRALIELFGRSRTGALHAVKSVPCELARGACVEAECWSESLAKAGARTSVERADAPAG